MYVWNMTQAVPWLWLAWMLYFRYATRSKFYRFWFKVYTQTDLNSCVLSVIAELWYWSLVSWPLFWGCTWVYVGGSTHWVGLRSAMTHPPSSEAWWNSTHKHTGLNTSCRQSFSTELKYGALAYVTSQFDVWLRGRYWDIWLWIDVSITVSHHLSNSREAEDELLNVNRSISMSVRVQLWVLFFFSSILFPEPPERAGPQLAHKRLKADCSPSKHQTLKAGQTCCFCSDWGLG